jgi:hypothetical protein
MKTYLFVTGIQLLQTIITLAQHWSDDIHSWLTVWTWRRYQLYCLSEFVYLRVSAFAILIDSFFVTKKPCALNKRLILCICTIFSVLQRTLKEDFMCCEFNSELRPFSLRPMLQKSLKRGKSLSRNDHRQRWGWSSQEAQNWGRPNAVIYCICSNIVLRVLRIRHAGAILMHCLHWIMLNYYMHCCYKNVLTAVASTHPQHADRREQALVHANIKQVFEPLYVKDGTLAEH